MGNLLTKAVGNVLTELMGKVLDIYTVAFLDLELPNHSKDEVDGKIGCTLTSLSVLIYFLWKGKAQYVSRRKSHLTLWALRENSQEIP